MAVHSNIPACRIPWTEGPGGLQLIGSQRVRHNWSDLARTHGSCSDRLQGLASQLYFPQSWLACLGRLSPIGKWPQSFPWCRLQVAPSLCPPNSCSEKKKKERKRFFLLNNCEKNVLNLILIFPKWVTCPSLHGHNHPFMVFKCTDWLSLGLGIILERGMEWTDSWLGAIFSSKWTQGTVQFSSVQFSRSVMSDSLWPHELQHARW